MMESNILNPPSPLHSIMKRILSILSPERTLLKNTLIVSTTTLLYSTVFVLVLYFWITNRQWHIRKGSQDKKPERSSSSSDTAEEEDDEEEEENKDKFREMRMSLQNLVEYETEHDSDDEDDSEDEKNNFYIPSSVPSSHEMRRDLMEIVSRIKVFSYLSSEAFVECIKYIEYVNLPRKGMTISEAVSEGDGSLYAVLSGEVTCTCDLPVEEGNAAVPLGFTAGPGDVVTSLLTMLSGLVRQFQLREQINNERWSDDETPLHYANSLRAVATEDNTRLIRVRAQCFLALLDKFPQDVYRTAQTILARMQRVTLQTLVKDLGLGAEILRMEKLEQQPKWKQADRKKKSERAMKDCDEEWRRLTGRLGDGDGLDLKDDGLKRDAAAVAAAHLGAFSPECIKLINDSSSIMSLKPGHVLIHSGASPSAIHLILRGELNLGMMRTPTTPAGGEEEEQQLKSNRRSATKRLHANGIAPSSFHYLFKLRPGQFANRLACFTGDVSIITMRNDLDAEVILLKIPKETFDSILSEYPQALMQCIDYVLFDIISPVMHLLDWNLEWMHVKTGEILARRGESCDSLFVVLNGRLRAVEHGGAREEYGRGACIGEVQVLTGAQWPWDVYAIRNTELARMPMSVLQAIIHMFPRAGLHFARVIASQVQSKHISRYGVKRGRGSVVVNDGMPRIRSTNSFALSRGTVPATAVPNAPSSILPSYELTLATVAVLPLTPDVSLSEFCSTLTSSLKYIAPTTLLTKTKARTHLGDKVFRHRNALHEMKMTRLLGEMEENYRLVVYQADTKYTWWTRLCIQQADCVLLLVHSDRPPEKKRVEQCLKEAYNSLHVRIELVVVRPPKSRRDHEEEEANDSDKNYIHASDQLNNWSEERPWIAGHHLVRTPFQTHIMDIHRMSRRITGRSVGLVLGGGGARGLAHLGVIRALTEAGVLVDMVGGTSQGAFVGALYAKNPDSFDTLMKHAKIMATLMAGMSEKILDLTLPLTSFFCGKRFNNCISKCIGTSTRIQDLVLNFFCVSTDVRKSVQVVHTKGLCWKYVRASMSLQGYLPPISEDGSLLLDGGYMNVLPADVMIHQMGARVVIAVDVSREIPKDYYEYGTHLNGWWVLWNSWNPFVKTVKIPSMGELSEKLAWVSAEQHKRNSANDVDLYLAPPVFEYGTLEFDKMDEIVEKGYKYAKPIVDKFVKRNPWLVSKQR